MFGWLVTDKVSQPTSRVRRVSNTKWSTDFTLGGLPVRLALIGERWVAHVGESVAVGSGALQVLTAALEPVGPARKRALLADLALLAPSIEVAGMKKRAG
jgi:hypothetical protein